MVIFGGYFTDPLRIAGFEIRIFDFQLIYKWGMQVRSFRWYVFGSEIRSCRVARWTVNSVARLIKRRAEFNDSAGELKFKGLATMDFSSERLVGTVIAKRVYIYIYDS